MDSGSPGASTGFSLRGGPNAITLESEGLHHPSGARRGGSIYTRYADVTHLATSPRALWIGTRRSVYVIARRMFVDPHGPEHLVRALLEQIARQPGGSAQLARMAQIEEAARTPGGAHATWALTVACLVVYGFQLLRGPEAEAAGSFIAVLVAAGDWWRIVTANLMHANVAHLILNLLGLVAVGSLVERSLGTARTVCVIALSGVGAMAASAIASPIPVVGVSGVVFGLVGALSWLELRFAESLPAWWRVPRRALLGMIAVSALISILPFIATAAHVGGFVAGVLGAAALGWRELGRRPSPPWVRPAAAASAAVGVLAVGVAAWEVLREGEYLWRYAARLASLPGTGPDALNDIAWMIAVDPDSTPELLGMALTLAERAVDETGREDPRILDTLAEVHFQLGHREEALAAIEEAILRDPEREYYHEQKRRFLGERDPEDRPFLPPPEPPEGAPAPTDTGLTV